MSDLRDWRPRPPTDAVTLEGRFVTVVPLDPGRHAPLLWDAFGGSATNHLLRYFPNPPFAGVDDFAAWLAGGAARGWQTHAFLDPRTGTPLGIASFMRTDAANGVTEVGAVAHGSRLARSPAATEAHYLLARHVFDTLGYRRYEWKLDNRNQPSHRAARRLGFSFEGVFRNHMVVKGENRDTAWYAMIDRDWPAIRAAFEAWLAPANFDSDGRQRQGLTALRGDPAGA